MYLEIVTTITSKIPLTDDGVGTPEHSVMVDAEGAAGLPEVAVLATVEGALMSALKAVVDTEHGSDND